MRNKNVTAIVYLNSKKILIFYIMFISNSFYNLQNKQALELKIMSCLRKLKLSLYCSPIFFANKVLFILTYNNIICHIHEACFRKIIIQLMCDETLLFSKPTG